MYMYRGLVGYHGQRQREAKLLVAALFPRHSPGIPVKSFPFAGGLMALKSISGPDLPSNRASSVNSFINFVIEGSGWISVTIWNKKLRSSHHEESALYGRAALAEIPSAIMTGYFLDF
jgi:hypothetical protein